MEAAGPIWQFHDLRFANPDWCKLAEAFDCKGTRADDSTLLERVLEVAFIAQTRPVGPAYRLPRKHETERMARYYYASNIRRVEYRPGGTVCVDFFF